MGALRFLWLATRGHRLAPWRSPYLRWRIETYWGTKAEAITAGLFFEFLWSRRGEMARFLGWANRAGR